ncbi:MAG: sigma 54-interacting transcriptional regulator, partial [Spirochaetes bacterium]|nr:sigma 54-interacting transcriptional regulator [Spirochaetota bacterium]
MDRKEKQLEILFEIARIITSSLDIQLILENILKLLNTHLEMNRGTITLYDSDTESIKINIAYGLKENEKKRGEYRVGEGITGKVVKSGKAEIIPDISKDERFLDKTKAREDVIKKNIISFICVPIKVENNSIGALSIDKIFSNKARFEEDLRFLNIIASIIAQAIKLNNLVLNERMNLIDENINLKNQLKEKYNIGNIIGNSNGMKEVYHLIERVSDSNATVLICGESGTGKELVASAIHYNSKRSNGSFVKINCSAFPESILESELFGYEKGAF